MDGPEVGVSLALAPDVIEVLEDGEFLKTERLASVGGQKIAKL